MGIIACWLWSTLTGYVVGAWVGYKVGRVSGFKDGYDEGRRCEAEAINRALEEAQTEARKQMAGIYRVLGEKSDGGEDVRGL